MAKSYLDKDGLLYFWQKIKSTFVTDVTYNSTSKKIQKTKAGSTSDVVTLSTVATSGSYNDLSNKPTIPTLKNVFGNVKVGSTTIAADTTQDTIELVAGSNVTLTPDATNDKVTIAATDTTYSEATTSAAGLMSASDKSKLNGIASGAEVNQNAFSNVKVGSTTVAADAKTDTLELVAGSNVTLTPDATNDKVTIAATDTTYSEATVSTAGLMSASDKVKLSGIASYAEVNQNAFSNVKVGSTTIAADGKTDTLELDSSFGIDITPDATNDKVTIGLNAAYVQALASGLGGIANGLCPLNASSKIDATYLPSYVDDVIEAYARSGQTALSSTWLATGSASGAVITPETGKIYVLMADSGDYAANTQFRWSGSAYVKLADGGVSSITNAEIDTIVAA